MLIDFIIILSIILFIFVIYKAKKFKRFNDRIYRDAGAEARRMREN